MKLLQGMMKKEKLVVILLIGLLLLIAAFPIKEREEPEILPEEINTIEQAKEEKDWQQQMEEDLERVLEKVKGVGKTEVILTCEGTEKKLPIRRDGDRAEFSFFLKNEKDTVYTKDAKGNQIPYLTSQEYPKVIGVVVVAEGGDNPVIISNIQEAVQVLFQVEAHKIKVMKMN